MVFKSTKRGEEMPVTVQGTGRQSDESVTTHPAFAQIGASRVSGHTNLYDSDFVHNHYMTITIARSELHRSLNRDWHSDREEYIQVALSESQWATFVSAPNVGGGVPCTLQRRNGAGIPGIPATDRDHQFNSEVKEDLAGAIADIDAALAAVDELGLSAKKAAMTKEKLQRARRTLDNVIPFVADQFAEYVEDTIEKGKQEIHGYMTNVIQRAGIEALSNGTTLPLQIDKGKK